MGESDDIQNGNRSMENVALYKADNGMQYAPLEVSEDFIWELNQKINAFGKAYFIRYLQNKSKNISVDLAFTYYKNGTVDSEKTENARKGLDRVLYEGDSVKISVRNNGNRPAYITILDIQPDDKINFIVPNVRQALMPNDYFVNPGETLNIPNFITMYPPYGREVFKLFASEEPVSFESILSDAIVSTRGFFQKTEIQLEDYTILDYAFEIKKKPFGAATSGKNSDGSSFYLTDRHGNIKTQQVHRQDTLYLNAGIDFQSKLYFNVLTLDQAQNVSVAYPANAFSEEHCILEAGPEFQLKYPVSVPAGNYVKYFVVSSDKPFDLRGYFASGENPRASLSELLISEKLPNRSLQDISCTSYFYTISESREDEVTRAGNDPVIEILTPQAEGNSKGAGVAQENTGMINISGFASTEDQRPVKEVRLNGQSVFYNANRQFFRVENYALAEGENRILIEAITDEGLKVSKILSFYIKPATEITKSSGKNYFVGIGINTYGCCGYDNLNNATRDVLDIADVMKNKYSFRPEDVILLLNEDATRSKIYRTLRDLVPLIDTNDKVFIYLSGHGNKDQIAQGGYFFIPSDISKDERGIVDESSLLSEDDILKPFKAYRARHSLLVVDACYSGLMVNPSSYGNDDGPVYNDIEKDPSKWIITSGRAEKVSDGTPGANSPFASVLISYLRNQKPGDAVQVSVLSNELQTNVKKVSNQTPLGMPVSGTGQFVFHAN